MKIIITEQQVNELVTSMLEDMFNGYKIKFEGDHRNVYVGDKLMAQLGPTTGVVSADAYNELKDNLFFTSDKDLKRDVRDWVVGKFGTKGTLYGVSFKKLHGQEKPIAPPKRPRDPRGAEKGYDIEGFRERTKKIENRLKNREDLIRLAKQKTATDTFEKWMEKEVKRDIEREKRKKEEMNLEKAIEAIRNAKKK
jgi:hypothetical protein